MGPETSSQEQQLRLALTTPAPPAPAPAKTTPVSTKTTALAPGFRFHPTDEELVIYYLKRKQCGFLYGCLDNLGNEKENSYFGLTIEGAQPKIDSYVLCRVFHKNNIGPPTGNRYAPFIEEEWDDRGAALIPGEDAADEVVVTYDTGGEMHRTEQDSHSINKSPLGITEVPGDSQNALPVCKTESVEDCPPLCVLNTEAPLTLLQYKRRKHNNETGSNRSNASENSTRTSQDPCSSTTTTAATTSAEMMMATTSATTTAISALLEFSLMEPLEPKENPRVPPPALDAASLDSSMSPSCRKFINDLQSEIHKISVERETLKLEMMSAHAMINILQSRVDFLNKENEDLKRSVHAK
ncbi:hypothetical protein D5086_020892 [Populus alba]|uniref:Uncharacterized protein n=1 Tax=Populus alba TaxID=43335 RepID=A0ACC4BLB2_POPAL